MIRLAIPLSLLAIWIPVETTTAQTPAVQAYVNCLIGATQQLDDHRSDAATIAQATVSACDQQWRAEKEEAVRGMNPAARQMTFEELDQKQLQVATQVVLVVRRKEQSTPPN